jgi:hypothetical protein
MVNTMMYPFTPLRSLIWVAERHVIRIFPLMKLSRMLTERVLGIFIHGSHSPIMFPSIFLPCFPSIYFLCSSSFSPLLLYPRSYKCARLGRWVPAAVTSCCAVCRTRWLRSDADCSEVRCAKQRVHSRTSKITGIHIVIVVCYLRIWTGLVWHRWRALTYMITHFRAP